MRLHFIAIFYSLLFTISIDAQTCIDLPVNFKSYTETLSKVKSFTFLIKEIVDCSKSSWIQSASYFSCNGETGYFIMKTKESREYIHKNMPIGVWRQYKKANSYGSFYNQNIKGKYQLNV